MTKPLLDVSRALTLETALKLAHGLVLNARVAHAEGRATIDVPLDVVDVMVSALLILTDADPMEGGS
jgi:hypothetical protein